MPEDIEPLSESESRELLIEVIFLIVVVGLAIPVMGEKGTVPVPVGVLSSSVNGVNDGSSLPSLFRDLSSFD